jgi:hypothetical protein
MIALAYEFKQQFDRFRLSPISCGELHCTRNRRRRLDTLRILAHCRDRVGPRQ